MTPTQARLVRNLPTIADVWGMDASRMIAWRRVVTRSGKLVLLVLGSVDGDAVFGCPTHRRTPYLCAYSVESMAKAIDEGRAHVDPVFEPGFLEELLSRRP